MSNSNPKITLVSFLFNIVGVPSNPKTSFDYMEGIFSDVKDDEKNLSPSVLKKKIENLQSSGHQHSKRWEFPVFQSRLLITPAKKLNSELLLEKEFSVLVCVSEEMVDRLGILLLEFLPHTFNRQKNHYLLSQILQSSSVQNAKCGIHSGLQVTFSFNCFITVFFSKLFRNNPVSRLIVLWIERKYQHTLWKLFKNSWEKKSVMKQLSKNVTKWPVCELWWWKSDRKVCQSTSLKIVPGIFIFDQKCKSFSEPSQS